jgi:hypothetical protein
MLLSSYIFALIMLKGQCKIVRFSFIDYISDQLCWWTLLLLQIDNMDLLR